MNLSLFFFSLLSSPHPYYDFYFIDFVTVFGAILTSRQTRKKLLCLYENLYVE